MGFISKISGAVQSCVSPSSSSSTSSKLASCMPKMAFANLNGLLSKLAATVLEALMSALDKLLLKGKDGIIRGTISTGAIKAPYLKNYGPPGVQIIKKYMTPAPKNSKLAQFEKALAEENGYRNYFEYYKSSITGELYPVYGIEPEHGTYFVDGKEISYYYNPETQKYYSLFTNLKGERKEYELKDMSMQELDFCPPGAVTFTKTLGDDVFPENSPLNSWEKLEVEHYISPIDGKEYPVNPINGQPESGYYKSPSDNSSHFYFYNPKAQKYMIEVEPLLANPIGNEKVYMELEQYQTLTARPSFAEAMKEDWVQYNEGGVLAPAAFLADVLDNAVASAPILGDIKQGLQIGVAADYIYLDTQFSKMENYETKTNPIKAAGVGVAQGATKFFYSPLHLLSDPTGSVSKALDSASYASNHPLETAKGIVAEVDNFMENSSQADIARVGASEATQVILGAMLVLALSGGGASSAATAVDDTETIEDWLRLQKKNDDISGGSGVNFKGAVDADDIPAIRASGGSVVADVSEGAGKVDINKALETAQQAHKGGETLAGHALQKHAGRNPDIWGSIKGGAEQINQQAMKHIDDIINGAGEFKTFTTDRGVQFWEKMLPDGRGLRLNLDGTFKHEFYINYTKNTS